MPMIVPSTVEVHSSTRPLSLAYSCLPSPFGSRGTSYVSPNRMPADVVVLALRSPP